METFSAIRYSQIMQTSLTTMQSMILLCVTGLVSGYLAYKRGRNPLLWFLIGAAFGLLGVMAFFFLPFPKKRALPPPSPQPYIHGPSDKFWYYLDATHQQKGPLSHTAVTNAWKRGELTPATLLWHEELPDWKPLQDLIRLQN